MSISLTAPALAAAPTPHSTLPPGLPLLAILALAALGFGATRLGRRRRGGGQGKDSAWLPQRQDPPPAGAAASPAVAAGPPEPAGPSAPPLAGEDLQLAASGEHARPARAVALQEAPARGRAVETHGLTKRFGANVAVNGVELLVPRGSAFGYLGPNGAGKTTLIRTLLGLTRADGGTMSLLGIPVPAERSRAQARVGAIVDEPRFHPHLTGRENLRLLAAARGGDARQRIGPSLERVGLSGRADDKVASYSMGMRQRLGVASCLIGDPELLILDEPMNGL
ncbi:MAG TPA: ABC transporter ATP-binding protein, partial [Streptosporangiaceae bacterium]